MSLPAGKPLYEAVKDHVRARIDSGEWTQDTRIPSENELGPMLGVSRITVNRAFKELADEGRLRKVPGVGTFVAEGKPRFGLLTLDSIAEQIAARGLRWHCAVQVLERIPAPPAIATLMDLPAGAGVFHSIVLHHADNLPIQLEERHVRPDHAPGYLDQDYGRATTFDYLRRASEVQEMEQSVTAIMPDRVTIRLLATGANEPCLLIRRRTFRDGLTTTLSQLTQPASRFEMWQRVRMHLPVRGGAA